MIAVIGLAVIMAGILLFVGLVCLYVDLAFWIATGKPNFYEVRKYSDVVVLLCTVSALAIDFPDNADGMGGSAVFTLPGQPVLCLLVLCCMAAYFYSVVRKRLGPALLEVGVNFLLLLALLLVVMTGIEETHALNWIFGAIPLFILVVLTLAGNYQLAAGRVFGDQKQEREPVS